jgi:hypothetical protein
LGCCSILFKQSEQRFPILVDCPQRFQGTDSEVDYDFGTPTPKWGWGRVEIFPEKTTADKKPQKGAGSIRTDRTGKVFIVVGQEVRSA